MRKSLLAGIGLLVLVAMGAGPKPRELSRDALGGKWDVTVTPDDDARRDKAREFTDVLTFKNSSFTSDELKKHGFETGTYDENTRPGAVGAFDAVQKSKDPAEGKVHWSGFVTATSLEGDLVWTKKDGTVWNFTFKGEKR